MTNFALVGAAGYIAPRHMKAIKEVGGSLLAAFDPNDSVGIIDSYFPDAFFFTEFEKFEEYVDQQKNTRNNIEYVGICSPNFLHKAHIRSALRCGARAICEKPLVLSPVDLDELEEVCRATGGEINTILQLRLHPAIIALKKKVDAGPAEKIYDIDLGYFTSRGAWYHQSWKGFEHKSGGVATNIGVHFFDMLGFVFGKNTKSVVHHRSHTAAAGYLEFERARVRWILSIDRNHLPDHTPKGQTTHRSILVDGQETEFSGGFTDLHTESYNKILHGDGYGIEDVRPSIEIVSHIRSADIDLSAGDTHPDIQKVLS